VDGLPTILGANVGFHNLAVKVYFQLRGQEKLLNPNAKWFLIERTIGEGEVRREGMVLRQSLRIQSFGQNVIGKDCSHDLLKEFFPSFLIWFVERPEIFNVFDCRNEFREVIWFILIHKFKGSRQVMRISPSFTGVRTVGAPATRVFQCPIRNSEECDSGNMLVLGKGGQCTKSTDPAEVSFKRETISSLMLTTFASLEKLFMFVSRAGEDMQRHLLWNSI
jgi:hypothetical protein